MTGTTRSSADLDPRRRKALFRSWHRGTREMDLILGGFADDHIGELTDAELDLYETILDQLDPSLFKWFSGEEPVPAEHDTAVYRKILDHRRHRQF
ncbi:succinate dehydrogenase assembly factor 2 [Mesorhizobium sp. J428]|uniref:FAD assembly factor SdhE n=1 Tax=Mesorhizobium sp. J428 TaxID=2898440 RepID=UPI0021519675|nr:succinate dehydrogenase assembly factor 2 [Mesorhizobium sp. J428]MCR5859656.1 succinate dehydrogenase assembly factor 2 [Mesorhizobium sp. J428]